MLHPDTSNIYSLYRKLYSENIGPVPVLVTMDISGAEGQEEPEMDCDNPGIQDTLKLIQHYAEELAETVTNDDSLDSDVGSQLSQALNYLECLHNRLVVQRRDSQESQQSDMGEEDCEDYV